MTIDRTGYAVMAYCNETGCTWGTPQVRYFPVEEAERHVRETGHTTTTILHHFPDGVTDR